MKNLRRTIPPLVFIVISIIAYVQATLVKTLRFGGTLGGDFFPKVISILTMVLSIVWLLIEFKNLKSRRTLDRDSSKESKQVSGIRNTFLFLLILVFSIWLMRYVGFLFSGLVLVFFNYIFLKDTLKSEDLRLAALYSVTVAVGIWYLFEKVFELVLPRGKLW
ncbi:tripartite tricarboxylate transporter TctB family protein [Fervidobacterium sp.]